MKSIRNIIVAAAMIFSASAAFAGIPSPEPIVISTALVPVQFQSFNYLFPQLSAEAAEPSPEPIVISTAAGALDFARGSASAAKDLPLTALAPAQLHPLANLDLIPEPETKAYPAVSGLNLDPRSVSVEYGRRYLQREVRIGTASDALFNANLLAMVALNVGDYLSTREALRYPGLSEGNPMMKPFVKSPVAFAAVKLGITALSYLSLRSLYKKNKPMAWIAALAGNFALSYVVSNNIRLINQAKAR